MMTVKIFTRILSIAVFALGGAGFAVFAQAPVTSAAPSCPRINVSAPNSVNTGGSLTVTANISGGDAAVTPTYNWTVSAGMIEEGQGTSTIRITTKGLEKDSTVTATVDVGGYNRRCSTSASGTSIITAGAEARKSDEFGNIVLDDFPLRLDNFKMELESETTAAGYIIAYGGRTDAPGLAAKIGAAAKKYLARGGKIDAARIVTVDGGYREELMVELWIVPEGATPPQASPTLDPSEVKPAKPAPANKVKGKKS